MYNYKKNTGKRDTILAVFYIECLQLIGIQAYARVSKPRENALF
jgi:hypothetical protein